MRKIIFCILLSISLIGCGKDDELFEPLINTRNINGTWRVTFYVLDQTRYGTFSLSSVNGAVNGYAMLDLAEGTAKITGTFRSPTVDFKFGSQETDGIYWMIFTGTVGENKIEGTWGVKKDGDNSDVEYLFSWNAVRK